MTKHLFLLLFISFSLCHSQGFEFHYTSNGSVGGTLALPARVGSIGFRYMQLQQSFPGGFTESKSKVDAAGPDFTRHKDFSLPIVFLNNSGFALNGNLRAIGKVYIGPSLRIRRNFYEADKLYDEEYLWAVDAGGGMDLVLFNFLVIGGDISIRHFFTFNLGLWF